MNIKKILKQFQKEINRRLVDFFYQKLKKSKKLSLVNTQMVKEIRDFTMRGGKRIRPILIYYGYLAAGGKNKKAILDACLFAELLHSYLLIHDDIIDRDEIRRGKPTVHCQYKENYKDLLRKAEHLGLCGGIMAGDLASSFSYEILTESNFSADLKNKVIKRLNQILEDVIHGQTLDILWGITRQLTKQDVFKIMEYKTARYTIEGPLHIGAILAGAGKKILQILSQYAVPLGIAFQIKDDILGVFGDPKITGKSASSDLKEGKQTLLILEAKRRANARQKKIIEQVLGNNKATEKQVSEVKQIIIETGALNWVNEQAQKLVNRAKLVIKKSNFSQEAKQFLIEVTDYILKRER